MSIRTIKTIASCLAAAVLATAVWLPVSAATPPGFAASEAHKYPAIQKKILQAQETNADVKGWLIVPGTNINEAIVHSSKRNSHYTNRDWRGNAYPITERNFSDYPQLAAFADYRVKWGETWAGTSRNTVIYGHNYTNLRQPLDIGTDNNHTMFGQLPSYTDLSFAREHPYIYYSTGKNEGIWAVFSVAYSEPGASYKYSHKNLIAEWKERSLFDFDIEVDASDHLLTLSTCTRQYVVGGDIYYEDQRFVVVARLLRDGESEKDTIAVTANPDPKPPLFPADAYVSSRALFEAQKS